MNCEEVEIFVYTSRFFGLFLLEKGLHGSFRETQLGRQLLPVFKLGQVFSQLLQVLRGANDRCRTSVVVVVDVGGVALAVGAVFLENDKPRRFGLSHSIIILGHLKVELAGVKFVKASEALVFASSPYYSLSCTSVSQLVMSAQTGFSYWSWTTKWARLLITYLTRNQLFRNLN